MFIIAMDLGAIKYLSHLWMLLYFFIFPNTLLNIILCKWVCVCVFIHLCVLFTYGRCLQFTFLLCNIKNHIGKYYIYVWGAKSFNITHTYISLNIRYHFSPIFWHWICFLLLHDKKKKLFSQFERINSIITTSIDSSSPFYKCLLCFSLLRKMS